MRRQTVRQHELFRIYNCPFLIFLRFISGILQIWLTVTSWISVIASMVFLQRWFLLRSPLYTNSDDELAYSINKIKLTSVCNWWFVIWASKRFPPPWKSSCFNLYLIHFMFVIGYVFPLEGYCIRTEFTKWQVLFGKTVNRFFYFDFVDYSF